MKEKRITKELDEKLKKIKPPKARWTLDNFLRSAALVRGKEFDYSRIKSEDIKSGVRDFVVICNTCGYEWKTNLAVHIRPLRHGNCPVCSGTISWTMERFVNKSLELHGEGVYDYSKLRPEQFKTGRSKVPLICNNCKKENLQEVRGHVAGYGCFWCKKTQPWTYKRFIETAKEIHGDTYDYSNVKPGDIQGTLSKLKIFCKECEIEFVCPLQSHIYRCGGCQRCASSKGEKQCLKLFERLGIECKTQFLIPGERFRYDFKFDYNGKKYILEWDGIQHFKYRYFFHRDPSSFYDCQDNDVRKTQHALSNGYKLIRISYKELKTFEDHFKTALNLDQDLYVSDEQQYEYLLTSLIEEGC
jgi:very-short-patch-repair endonuclease